MKKILMVLTITAVALALAGAATAGHGFHHRIGGPAEGSTLMFMHGRGHLAEELGLTDEQKTELKQLHADLRAKAEPLMEQHRKQMEEIHTLLDAGNANATELGERMIAAHATSRQLRAQHEEGWAGFKALLTEEQRAKLEELEESRPKRRVHRMMHPGF